MMITIIDVMGSVDADDSIFPWTLKTVAAEYAKNPNLLVTYGGIQSAVGTDPLKYARMQIHTQINILIHIK